MNKKTMRLGTLLLMAALFLSACGAGAGKSSDAPAGGSEASVAQVWKLTIVQPPEKLEYEEGETFDPAGVVINAKLKDGSMLENVAYEGIIVDQPLTRTSLFAKFVYGGETVEQNIKVTLKGNREEYSVAGTRETAGSPLAGNGDRIQGRFYSRQIFQLLRKIV